MPKIKINNKEIEVPNGATIIEAFKKLDENIAHYCWHPALSVAGVCRLCMVEIEGNPRLQIACNTVCQEGMVINNNSPMVQEAVKWGMDFHLINHPLDCPICDQAGECGLQEQYMKYGSYDSEMAERKVKKRKVVDLGSKIVLDSERCILCSRCVRFTKEVTKTNELGIFNRGDRSEIGVFEDKPLENNYAVNTVDICPVGALTSKEFRFQQRVWYLKNKPSVCTGCSTGCSIKVYYNEEGAYRVKPEHNDDVNGYWMCDRGRDIFKYSNSCQRLQQARVYDGDECISLSSEEVLKRVGLALHQKGAQQTSEVSSSRETSGGVSPTAKIALVMTGHYSNEENEALLNYFVNTLKGKDVYHWWDHKSQAEEFDGLLYRGDRNPNTKGLQQSFEKWGVQAKDLSELKGEEYSWVIVAGPQMVSEEYTPRFSESIKSILPAERVLWFTVGSHEQLNLAKNVIQIPVKTTLEKTGTFINYKGDTLKFNPVLTFVGGALSLVEATDLLQGKNQRGYDVPYEHSLLKTNYFSSKKDSYEYCK